MKSKITIGAIILIITLAFLGFQAWAVEPVIDRTVHGPFHFRDFRTVNESGLAPGDFLTFGIDVVPNGDFDPIDGCADNPGCPVPPTTIVATQGSTNIALNFSPSGEDASGESIDPNHFVRSVNYSSDLTGGWQYTISNGSDSINQNTPTAQLADGRPVPSMPKVSNMSLSGSGPTPTFHWAVPEIPGGLTLDAVTIEIRDLENRGPDGTATARRIFSKPIGPLAQFFDMQVDAPDVLLPNHRYEVGIQLDHRRNAGGVVSRSRSYFGFSTVILDVPGNAPVFIPSVDTTGVDPRFVFDMNVVAGQMFFIDPAVATGYDYQIGSGDPKFRSVVMPKAGDNIFDIYLWNGSKYVFRASVGAGFEYKFPSGGVDRFRVLGIESSAGLEPNDATAFVTGLTFVSSGRFTGTMTPIIAEALCATLGDDRRPSLLDQDIYTLQGTKGEKVVIGLEKSGNSNTGGKATLMLVDNINRVHLLEIDNGSLPSQVDATLPATGEYLAIVAEQPQIARGSRYRGNYCLTVQSSAGAAQTLKPTGWVE